MAKGDLIVTIDVTGLDRFKEILKSQEIAMTVLVNLLNETGMLGRDLTEKGDSESYAKVNSINEKCYDLYDKLKKVVEG